MLDLSTCGFQPTVQHSSSIRYMSADRLTMENVVLQCHSTVTYSNTCITFCLPFSLATTAVNLKKSCFPKVFEENTPLLLPGTVSVETLFSSVPFFFLA